jgi:hypothetical protein
MRAVMVAGALAMAACGPGGLLSSAAHAQQPTQSGPDGAEYCVYLKLTDTSDYVVVAEGLLAGLDQDKAQAAVKAAGDACIKEYGMSQNEAAIASDVGIFGAAADYLIEGLADEGVSDDVIDGLYAVIDEMSDEDLDLIFDGSWRDDAAMKARLRAAVVAKGIPDEDRLVQDASLLIEVSTLGSDAVMNYLMVDMDAVEAEES